MPKLVHFEKCAFKIRGYVFGQNTSNWICKCFATVLNLTVCFVLLYRCLYPDPNKLYVLFCSVRLLNIYKQMLKIYEHVMYMFG